MNYTVSLHRAAEKDLETFPSKDQRRINEKIVLLSENPRPQKAVKLQDGTEAYRLRVGDYRIIYDIDDKKKEVAIGRIDRRSEATYRK